MWMFAFGLWMVQPAADLALVGVVVSPRSEASSAIVRSGGRTRVVKAGESAFGGRVLEIGPTFAILDFEGARVELRLRGEPVPVSAPPSAPRAALELDPPPDPATPPQMLERKEVDRRLSSEIPRILAETAMVPAMQDGRIVGFTLTRVPEGSLLSDVGLRVGDVLVRINDTPIDSMATLIGLYTRLQNQQRLHAVVLREGRPVSLAVTFK
jgi:type II secretion system protein C